jgi:hypothetical protein
MQGIGVRTLVIPLIHLMGEKFQAIRLLDQKKEKRKEI